MGCGRAADAAKQPSATALIEEERRAAACGRALQSRTHFLAAAGRLTLLYAPDARGCNSAYAQGCLGLLSIVMRRRPPLSPHSPAAIPMAAAWRSFLRRLSSWAALPGARDTLSAARLAAPFRPSLLACSTGAAAGDGTARQPEGVPPTLRLGQQRSRGHTLSRRPRVGKAPTAATAHSASVCSSGALVGRGRAGFLSDSGRDWRLCQSRNFVSDSDARSTLWRSKRI